MSTKGCPRPDGPPFKILPFLGLLAPFLVMDADSASTKNATMNANTDAGNSNTGGSWNDRQRRRRLQLPVRNSHFAIVVYKVTYLIILLTL